MNIKEMISSCIFSSGFSVISIQDAKAPAAYVAEDGLVGHQWEERPLGLRVFDAPV